MELALETYRHPTLGFAIDLPPGLELHASLPGAALVAVEREDALPHGAFRSNLTVIAQDVGPGVALDAQLERSLLDQERVLEGFRLLDREATTLAGLPAVRTLAHHRSGGDLAVVAEQWTTMRDGLAWTVTCTCEALAYDVSADVLSAAAESLRFEARG